MDKRQRLNNQTIALAGLFQAAHLVEQIAKTGQCNENSLRVCIESLMDINPRSVAEIYGGEPENLRTGLKEVRFLTDGKSRTGSSPDVIRYALSILHLESKLRKSKGMMQSIGKGVDSAKRQAEHFHTTHENLLANLSGLYQDTLSTFKFRIHVTGNSQHLQNPNNAHKIRALLLSGVRAAILWRQMGGRRWQLLFNRKRLNRSAVRALGDHVR